MVPLHLAHAIRSLQQKNKRNLSIGFPGTATMRVEGCGESDTIRGKVGVRSEDGVGISRVFRGKIRESGPACTPLAVLWLRCGVRCVRYRMAGARYQKANPLHRSVGKRTDAIFNSNEMPDSSSPRLLFLELNEFFH